MNSRYTFKGRLKSASTTFKEKTWIDGTRFTFRQRIMRTIRNFLDMPRKI